MPLLKQARDFTFVEVGDFPQDLCGVFAKTGRRPANRDVGVSENFHGKPRDGCFPTPAEYSMSTKKPRSP